MFAFFDDFGIDVALNKGPVEAESRRLRFLTGRSMAARSTTRSLPGRHPRLEGWIRPGHPAHRGTNFVPHVTGARSVSSCDHNAPFRLYMPYNPLRFVRAALLQRG